MVRTMGLRMETPTVAPMGYSTEKRTETSTE
jgi:hypothetical protein